MEIFRNFFKIFSSTGKLRASKPGAKHTSRVHPMVHFTQESARANHTQEIPGSNNPVWNEVSAFDILQGTDKLSVEVQDVQPNRERTPIG